MSSPIEVGSARWRVLRTVWQVIVAVLVVLPSALATVDGSAVGVAKIVAWSSVALVLVSTAWNAVTRSYPGPLARWLRTLATAVIAALAAVPSAAQVFNESVGVTSGIGAAIGAVVVLVSAVQNRLDAGGFTPRT